MVKSIVYLLYDKDNIFANIKLIYFLPQIVAPNRKANVCSTKRHIFNRKYKNVHSEITHDGLPKPLHMPVCSRADMQTVTYSSTWVLCVYNSERTLVTCNDMNLRNIILSKRIQTYYSIRIQIHNIQQTKLIYSIRN